MKIQWWLLEGADQPAMRPQGIDRRRTIQAAYEAVAREVGALPWRWPVRPRRWTIEGEELILR